MTPPLKPVASSGAEHVFYNLAAPGQTEVNGAGKSPLVVNGVSQKDAKAAGYGLRNESLSPMETLAQSVSGACPTLTPFVTVPLVYTLAGNGTWLAYVLGTGGILLVAWCISRFARYSSSPGSLYSYAAMILPPWLAATAAWSLLLAYIMGSASNIGAFYYYANVILRSATGHGVSTLLLAAIMGAAPMWFAWRDVKISARVMLLLEAVSVTLIIAVMALVLFRHGLHGDPNQLHLRGVTSSGFRQGLVLALYSFVGFEAATTLGSEARNPLRAIPRAVILTAVLGGVFFTICAYTEILGARHERKRSGHIRRAHARACASGRYAGAGIVDRSRSAGKLICGEFGWHHRRCPRVAADVAQRTDARLPPENTHAKRNSNRRHDCHGSRGVSSGRFPCREGNKRGRRLWMVGHARRLWICRELWTGVLCPSGLSARSPRRGQPRNEDHPLHRGSRYGVRGRRESLSRARRRIWQAALRLPFLPGRGSIVFCIPLAAENLLAGGILSAAQDLLHRPSSLFCAIPGELFIQIPNG